MCDGFFDAFHVGGGYVGFSVCLLHLLLPLGLLLFVFYFTIFRLFGMKNAEITIFFVTAKAFFVGFLFTVLATNFIFLDE